MTSISKLPVSTIGHIASAVARERRQKADVRKILWWTADEIYRKVVIATGKSSRKCPDEARNVCFCPAKPILLWSSSHADRRRSTEIGYIFVSRWNACVSTEPAEDVRGVSFLFVNRLSFDPAAIHNQVTSSCIYLTNDFRSI